MELSIIIPAFNEQNNIVQTINSIDQEVKKFIDNKKFEIIIINDGSTDQTLKKIKNLSITKNYIKIINFTRNFGKEIALSAGIKFSQGKAVIIIDADGQHPIELMKDFYALWLKGYLVVVGVRKSNQNEGFIKKQGSKYFYHILNKISKTKLIPGSSDYRLIDRLVCQEFNKFDEHYRITRGLIDWMGFKTGYIDYHANSRSSGKANYNISKLFSLAINSFISLSMTPLYAISYLGVFITLVSFISGLFVFIEQIILTDPFHLKMTGTAMLSIVLIFFVGIILTVQGLLALYISHIYAKSQNRPLYIIDSLNSMNIKI